MTFTQYVGLTTQAEKWIKNNKKDIISRCLYNMFATTQEMLRGIMFLIKIDGEMYKVTEEVQVYLYLAGPILLSHLKFERVNGVGNPEYKFSWAEGITPQTNAEVHNRFNLEKTEYFRV